jgi:signal peptidase I
MALLHAATRVTRRVLDVLLVLTILFVLATVVVARIIPMLTGGATFVIGGGSMEPTIPLGAVVLDVPVAHDQLAVGDIVTVQVGEQKAIFTHRIVRLVPRSDGLWIQTKGDANPDNDPSIIPATSVVGRVDTVIPYAGFALTLLSTGQGVLFLLALAVMLLAGAWLLEGVEVDQEIALRKAARARAAITAAASSAAAAASGDPAGHEAVAS